MNIAQHLERAQRLFPSKLALVFEGQSFTYGAINDMSNRIANALVGMGISRGDRVALFLPNIPPFVIVYLGIQKMGAIAVCINSALKNEEIKFILDDSGAKIIVTTETLRGNIKDLPQLNSILIAEGGAKEADIALSEWMANASPKAQAVSMTSDDPAVILYTSGTTGFPKGAVLSHGNVVSNVRACVDVFKMQHEERILLFLPLFHNFGQNAAFNPCFEAGATLVLHRKFEIDSVLKSIIKNNVTTFYGVPTIYTLLYDKVSAKQMDSIHRYISAAAILPLEISRKWHDKFGVVINEGYGLTENSLACFNHFFKYKPGSVGSPLSGVEMKIVDAEGNEVAPGKLGEITIRGSNVMLEYWNRPKETAEVIKDGWFHTGDIGKMDEDGYFYIVDRVKDMVNVGGLKVHPSEVENLIYQHPAVLEAAVYGIKDALMGEQVRASIVLKPAQTLTEEKMIAFCCQHLAPFKVPSTVEFVNSLPKSKTGKILTRVLRKRRQMPPSGVTKHEEQNPFIEIKIVETLSSILINKQRFEFEFEMDTFFTKLGVDSISAMAIINQLNKIFAIQLKTTDLFNFPTIRQLTNHIAKIIGSQVDSDNVQKVEKVEPISGNRYSPSSFAQENFWFYQKLNPTDFFFNIFNSFRIIGKLDEAILRESFNEIICRHEILRTTFQEVNGSLMQIIAPASTVNMSIVKLQDLPKNEQGDKVAILIKEEVQRSFDLVNGPLWCITLILLGEESYVMLLCIHHIIVDKGSLDNLFKELAILYEAFSLGKPSPLLPLPLQYAGYAQWQRQFITTEMRQTQLNYWKQWLAKGEPPLLTLPIDRPRPSKQTFRANTQWYKFSPELTQKLKFMSQQQEVTLFTTILTALVILLYRYSGNEDIVVAGPFSNRNHWKFEPLIGAIFKMLILRIDIGGNPSFLELLTRVQQVVFESTVNQGDVPFEQFAKTLQPERKRINPLHNVFISFFTGSPQEQLKLPGLSITLLENKETVMRPDLALVMWKDKNVSLGTFLQGWWQYKTDLFEADTITRMANNFQRLLEAIVDNPGQSVDKLPFLTDRIST